MPRVSYVVVLAMAMGLGLGRGVGADAEAAQSEIVAPYAAEATAWEAPGVYRQAKLHQVAGESPVNRRRRHTVAAGLPLAVSTLAVATQKEAGKRPSKRLKANHTHLPPMSELQMDQTDQLDLTRAAKAADSQLARFFGVVEYGFSPRDCQSWWCPATWLSYLNFVFVLKSLCVISNLAQQVSPYPSVQKFEAVLDTGDNDPLPYVAIGFNGAQWCFYGLFAWKMTGNHGFLILVYANVLGAVLGCYYTLAFQRCCRCEQTLRKLTNYCGVAGAVAALQVSALIIMSPENALVFSGMMPSICGVVVTASCSQLSCLPQVFLTGCTDAINTELAIASIASSMLWLSCGVLFLDWWLILPNAIGVLCGAATLGTLMAFGGPSSLWPWGGGADAAGAAATRDVSALGAEDKTPLCKWGPVATPPPLACTGDMGDTGGTSRCVSASKFWV